LKVTVYFTQPDFDDYNNNNGNDLDMPTGPLDVNKFANVRISQYHGNILPGCNLQDITPACYSGPATSVTPDLVAWNSGQNRWEVTFSVSSFSGFYFTTNIGAPLPLTLISFDAVKKDKLVQLNWITTQEINTSHFLVQRGGDGITFNNIGRVEAKNTSGNNNYSLADASPVNGVNFYRLKMIDIDGKITYSSIIKIVFARKNELQVFPNPAKNSITLSGLQNKGIIKIMAADGKLIKQLSAKAGSMLIDLSTLAKGVYLLQYNNEVKTEQVKIIKE
ncbi:MAG: T9SS type A sorting domain-containing protein, partial [Ginsengibacter sp.]